MPRFELLESAGLAANRGALAELLMDAVNGGASVGYLAPLSKADALDYWRDAESAVGAGSRLLLAAWDGESLAGTVQLLLAGMPNGAHRAEIAKLLVHSKARRKGLGLALMHALEEEARRRHRTLLVLDTEQGTPAEALYRRLGYRELGAIPAYARGSDGELHATVIFYKSLKYQ